MPDNVIAEVNQIWEDDGPPDGIVFRNIRKESTMEDMYGEVDSQDDSICASDKSWDTRVHQELSNLLEKQTQIEQKFWAHATFTDYYFSSTKRTQLLRLANLRFCDFVIFTMAIEHW